MASPFASSITTARMVILVLWSIIPFSWLFVLSVGAARLDARYQFLPTKLRAALPSLAGYHIVSLIGHILFAYCLVEVVFSIYHYILIRQAQRLLPPHVHDHEFLRGVMRRALGSGMASAYPSRHANGDAPSSKQTNGYALRSKKSAAELQPPSAAHSRTPSPLPSRPASPSQFCPVDQLDFDDPRASDFRENIRMWFHNCPWTEIHHDNVIEWLSWSLFGMDVLDMQAADAESMRSGSKKELKQDLLDECMEMIQNRAGMRLPAGKNPRVKVIRLTLDPVTVSSRPFLIYALAGLGCWAVQRALCRKGFKHGRARRPNGMEYLVRIPPGWKSEDSDHARPLIFLHGLGIGFAQYAQTLHYFADSRFSRSRPVLIPIQPHISMSLFHPSHLRPPSKEEMTEDLLSVMDELGFQSIDVLGHSNGTVVAAWVLKALPQLVRRLCLVDPVCFCLWEPQVCYNFLYATPSNGIELLMRYFVGTEIGVALTLQRYFNWSTNILWPADVPGFVDPERLTVFLAGKDGIVNARRVRRYLLENGMEDADSVTEVDGVEVTRDGDNDGGGGLVVDWRAAHGESLISGGKQFRRVVRWLQGEGLGRPPR